MLFWRETQVNNEKSGCGPFLYLEILFILSGPLTILLIPFYTKNTIKWSKARLSNFIKLIACTIQFVYISFNSLSQEPQESKSVKIFLVLGDSLRGFLQRFSTPWTFQKLDDHVHISLSLIIIAALIALSPKIPRPELPKVFLLIYLILGSYVLGLYGFAGAFHIGEFAAPRYILIPLFLAFQLTITIINLALPSFAQSKILCIFIMSSITSIFFTHTEFARLTRTTALENMPLSFSAQIMESFLENKDLSYPLRNAPNWTMHMSANQILRACNRSLIKCSFLD